ncbi:MAG TPA: ribokinase [Candidatus Sulfotelmatobacter sp.]|jgi:ribokinase|nr:ribokinase [Candidatus Sulfotelmatobacter sp.]
MKPIVVIGSINIDLVSTACRISRAGETITGKEFQMYSGGKGANQAVGVARLGYPCILLGKVGDDIFGQKLRSTLSEFGVDITHLGQACVATGTASIVVDDTGENCIIVTPGANAEVTPSYLEPKLDVLQSAGMVLLQLEIPIATIEWILQQCEKYGIPVMLDPAPAQTLSPMILGRITWFTPNETEAGFYAHNASGPEETIARLRQAGLHNIILKRGSKGAIVANTDAHAPSIPAFAVRAVDSTAAGDSFNAAFAVALMKGEGPDEAARFASAAAALSVTRKGAQTSLPSASELTAFFDVLSASGASSR